MAKKCPKGKKLKKGKCIGATSKKTKKKRTIKIVVGIVMAFVLIIGAYLLFATREVTSLNATQDTHVTKGSGQPQGFTTDVLVGRNQGTYNGNEYDYEYYAFYSFDIPASFQGKIISATFKVFSEPGTLNNLPLSSGVEVYETGSFIEGDIISGTVWDTKPDFGALLDSKACNLDSVCSFDVTDAVIGKAGQEVNFGMKSVDAGANIIIFISREHSNSEKRPVLEVKHIK